MLRIASLDVNDESDIDWKSLSDPGWNMWSGHYLHQKWRSLKASCNDESIVRHHGEYKAFILLVLSAMYSQ